MQRSLLGGGLLLAVAAFMFFGFMRSSASLPLASTIIAFVITVAVPAGFGFTMIARALGATRAMESRRNVLRLQTVESELLKLAGGRGGRLTVVEVVAELAVSAEDAKAALDSLVTQEIGDLAVTDSGTIVYTFRDIERATEKSTAKHILD